MERYLLGWEEYYERKLLQRAMDPKALEMYASLKQFSVYKTLDTYWYLGLLGVDPKYQRRGIGAKLVKHGFSMAQEGGLPMALEATVAGKGLYSKLGFKTIQKLRVGPLSEEIVAMLWEPESLKGRWLGDEEGGSAKLKVP
jgi:ribosomal protein S18 acetylase RimI-like enzyme